MKSKNCSLVQVLTQELVSGKVVILRDRELFEKMDAQNKAALLFHEVTYRKESEITRTSDEVRKYIGRLAGVDGINDPHIAEVREFTDTEAFVATEATRGGTKGVLFHFTHYVGKVLWAESTAFSPDVNFKDLTNGAFKGLNLTIENKTLKLQWGYRLAPLTRKVGPY